MKIAIIGTGIAGNVAAYRLAPEHDITVFEANDYIGGHSNTVRVPSVDGTVPLDTGFIVFNDRTYPNFVALLDELGVESQKSSMSFSVQAKETGLEYNGSNLNSLFAQRSNLLRPSFYRLIRDILRFNREAPEFLASNDLNLSLGDYLEREGYSREFSEHYLIPMGAAIWSAELVKTGDMPAHFFIRFFENHGLLDIKNRPQWYTIRFGSAEYVRKLVAAHRDRIRLGCAVESVTRHADYVQVKAAGCDTERFDYVFFACHSDQALEMLTDAAPVERDILGAIPYQQNEAILHVDPSLMPSRRLAWGAWNYHLANDEKVAGEPRATLTYHLNCLQDLDTREQYFVSLNSGDLIDESAVIRRISYEHPVFNAESVAAQGRHAEINGLNRSYYCGAYWRYGFHEDGVVSALTALEAFRERREDAQQYFQRAG